MTDHSSETSFDPRASHASGPPDLPLVTSRPTWPWWLAAVTWFVATSLAHLEFSLWLVSPREGPFGSFRYAQFVPLAASTGLLVLLMYVYRQSRAGAQPKRLVMWWLMWFACVIAFDRHLTFSSNEIAHYPQYALLAWLLARALDPDKTRWVAGRILFWTALLGMADEFQQYVWIAPAYGLHLDFNDFLVNLVAAAAGVMLYYCVSLGHFEGRAGPKGRGRPMVAILVGLTLAISVAYLSATDRLATTPTTAVPPGGWVFSDEHGWRLYLEREAGTLGSVATGPRHGRYYILDPLQAFMLMALFGLVFGRYPRWPWEWRWAGRLEGPEHRAHPW